MASSSKHPAARARGGFQDTSKFLTVFRRKQGNAMAGTLRDDFSLRLILRDLAALCLLATTAAATGLLLSFAGSHPLPWRYVSKENRLDVAVQRSVPAVSADPAAKPKAIDLEDFQRFAAEKHGVVLDARAEIFYRLGHVPGALNLSREAFEKDYALLQPVLTAHKHQPIAVYCSGADCQDSELVAQALIKLGYSNLLIYPEGWEQWTEAGLPQESPGAAHE